jgi:quercetin dioxygenase-like cupin family protein
VASIELVTLRHRRPTMSRISRLFSLIAIVTLGFAVSLGSGGVRAQDATPTADEMSMDGLTFALLGVVPGVMLPGAVDLQVARSEFEPGAGFPFDASDPNGALVIVESGALTIHVEEQAWTISRGAALQQAMASPDGAPDMTGALEEIAMGEEATLQAGDVAYVPRSHSGEVRNNGQEPASALLVIIGPESMMMGDATPAP